jgi:hypothetical protein
MSWNEHVLDPVTGSRVSLAAFRRFTDAVPRLLWLRGPRPARVADSRARERARCVVMAYLVGMATAEIGPLFDVSQQRVSQILHRELRRQCEWAQRWMVRPA